MVFNIAGSGVNYRSSSVFVQPIRVLKYGFSPEITSVHTCYRCTKSFPDWKVVVVLRRLPKEIDS